MSAFERAQAKWNAEADQYNQWDELGQDEKDRLIAKAEKELRAELKSAKKKKVAK
jgi:hypothetical protein